MECKEPSGTRSASRKLCTQNDLRYWLRARRTSNKRLLRRDGSIDDAPRSKEKVFVDRPIILQCWRRWRASDQGVQSYSIWHQERELLFLSTEGSPFDK